MNENILLYHVKPGDTLDKIGNKIGMTGDQLKDFHNAHCIKMDRLWFNNLVGVKQVIIPKEYKSPEQLKTERKSFLHPTLLKISMKIVILQEKPFQTSPEMILKLNIK